MTPLTRSKMIRNTFVTLAVVVFAGAISAGIASPGHHLIQPREVVVKCPAGPGEDACTADYRDGAWHIAPAHP